MEIFVGFVLFLFLGWVALFGMHKEVGGELSLFGSANFSLKSEKILPNFVILIGLGSMEK